jgi:hypothetical protein
MSDKVIPLEQSPRLGSMNGIGWTMMGLTRVDRDGNCFGTRWFTLFGLPILPLDRFYLKELGTQHESQGIRQTKSTSRYQVFGTAPLSVNELIRTYLYCWLFGPLIGAGPLVVYLLDADHLAHSLPGGVITYLVLLFVVLLVSIGVLVTLHEQYRKHLAPLREAEFC